MSYIGVYSPQIKENYYPKGDRFKVLFTGRVSRYKNVELILEVAEKLKDKNIYFFIAGSCDDADFKNEIINRVKELPNVDLDLRFLPDNELDQLLRQFHILMVPYDTKSSMNSGTVLLAFSNGRTVICPEICTIKEFNTQDIYSYQYDTEKQHKEELLTQVLKAYNDWTNDRKTFEEKGTRMFNAVLNNNSPEKLELYYQKLLNDINNHSYSISK